ncbi:hypothetical protein KM043_013642 [Ampulex compressa]|nr:hypothetical protein KM043_013642 [Ampulex compressa]
MAEDSPGQCMTRDTDPLRSGKQLLVGGKKRMETGTWRMVERRGGGGEKRGYHLAYLAYAYLKTNARIPARTFHYAKLRARTRSRSIVQNCAAQCYSCCAEKTVWRIILGGLEMGLGLDTPLPFQTFS